MTADPAGKLHDRVRDYDRIRRAIAMPEGQVMNPRFTTTALTTVQEYSGYRDAAIWTGSALAAQSWRYMTTREPDAAAEIDALVRTLHRSFNVSGIRGYLARVVVPKGSTIAMAPARCGADNDWHCNVTFDGKTYDWVGGTSRDQNTGVMLGYFLAYLATPNEELKAMIRDDVVAMAEELMKARKVPARVVVNGIPINTSLDLENVILAPSEMDNGRVVIDFSTSQATDSGMRGMREFFPDFSVLTKQVIGVNVPIKRPSTSIMLGAFFQIALAASDGVPAMAARRKALEDYYKAHASSWLDIAEGWTLDTQCGKGYFANHIALVMAYAYASLEKDPALLPRIRDKVFGTAMYGALAGHKNSYFTFLWGGTRASPAKADIDRASAQLLQFPVGPRVNAARDSRAMALYMPHDTQCTAEVLTDVETNAVDVRDRVVEDFMWQRQPWALYDAGDPTLVYPGVDVLAAYWAGRKHGFLEDDCAGTCARWAP
ncbi:MAG: hypothetical protein QM702_21455 [Rubrivivax sp.]